MTIPAVIDLVDGTVDPGPPAVDSSIYLKSGTLYKQTAGGVVTPIINGASSVSNSDGTLTISPTTGAVVASRAAITGDVSVPVASNVATLASTIAAGGPTGSSSVVPVITYDAKGRLTTVTTATITPASISAVPTTRLINTTAPITGGGDLSADRTIAMPAATGGASGYVSATTQTFGGDKTFTGNIFPKNIEGTVYVDPSNSQGWAGADAGAWINSAFAFIHTTYTDNNGGIIQLAAGSYSYSTPIVLANAGLMSCWLRGAGDGNGSTILNYTSASGIAIAVGGGSGNDGGIQLSDFTLTGTAQGNGATGIQFGVTGVANVAGATCKNISIRRFTNGFAHLNGNSYGIVFLNCKVQQCTSGYTPQGENNNWHGGLLGGCATGLVASNACEYQMFGVAFDDNTVTGINSSNSLARGSLYGCRFENAGGGLDTYITISLGAIMQQGGGMQNDILGAGTSTGFVQASGGVYSCIGTWLESAAGSVRVFTQIFNLTGTVIAHIDPVISPVGAITGLTQLCTAGYPAKRIDWLRPNNSNSALQSAVTVAGTPVYMTSSNLNIPPTAIVGIAIGTTFRWRTTLVKTAAGTGAFNLIIFMGVNGTTADTALVTQSIGTQTAAVDTAVVDVQVSFSAVGAGSGSMFWSITSVHAAAASAGFGQATTPIVFSGTVSALTTTTSNLKLGLGFTSVTGTPTITVPLMSAQVFNLD